MHPATVEEAPATIPALLFPEEVQSVTLDSLPTSIPLPPMFPWAVHPRTVLPDEARMPLALFPVAVHPVMLQPTAASIPLLRLLVTVHRVTVQPRPDVQTDDVIRGRRNQSPGWPSR